MTAKIIYTGDLRTAATHLSSGTELMTDAPVDNQGKGARFSPTDLVATSLGSCMITIMGIAANTHNLDIVGTHCTIEKIMTPPPRRIGEIKVDMHMQGQDIYTDKQKSILEHAAMHCPVMLSLHPDIIKTVKFHW